VLKIKHFSDKRIIESLCKDERQAGKAIQHLLDENRTKVTSYVLKNNGDDHDASTVLVEGVTHLVFNVRKGKFRGESQLSTYLFAICRGVWLKELKKNNRYTSMDEELNVSKDLIEDLTPFQLFSDEELKKDVNFLLDQLGNACKMVLQLWAKHFSMTEISNQLGYKNAQIAMNKKNRCLTKLKGIVSENVNYSESLKSYLN